MLTRIFLTEAVVGTSSAKRCSKIFRKIHWKVTCATVPFFVGLRPVTLLKEEALAQDFSSEFCEIFKNSFFLRRISLSCFCPEKFAATLLFLYFYHCVKFQEKRMKRFLENLVSDGGTGGPTDKNEFIGVHEFPKWGKNKSRLYPKISC